LNQGIKGSNKEMENRTNTTKVTAPDIVCGGCASAIKKALGSVEGVREVDVNVESKAVKVEHEPNVSREQIIETLDRAGFPSS
jgi:copper chaperone